MYAKRVALLFLFCFSCQERPTKELYDFFDQFRYIQEITINPFFLQKEPGYLPNDTEKWLIQYKSFDQQIHCLFIKLHRDQKKLYLKNISIGKGNCNALRDKQINEWNIFSGYGFIDVFNRDNLVKINFSKGQKVISINIEKDIQNYLAKNGLLLNRKMANHLKLSPLLKKGEYCLKFDDDCKEVITDKCYSCESSWSYHLEGQCKEKINRVCGDLPCGALNQPACLRGQKHSNYSGELCQKDSPFGLCHKGLKVHCEGNRVVCRNY